MSTAEHTRFFMSGGGVAGEMLRTFNWNDSPLGNPDQWPPSLKTAVSIIIRAKYPMFLWWGPSLININNDAYVPLMGNKFPAYFGKPAPEAWAEIWQDFLLPMKNLVFEKGESVYGEDVMIMLNRKEFVDENYFNFSYSPIFEENGKVGGLFCACQESTGKFLRTRRLHNLSTLKSNLTQARNQQDACTEAIAILKQNRNDIPFAALYRLDMDQGNVSLLDGYGFDEKAFPRQINLADRPTGPFWDAALGEPFEWRKLLYGVNSHIARITGFVTNTVPDKAMRMVVTGDPTSSIRWLIFAGISPHREFDADYRDYFEQINSGITVALENISKLETELSRVEQLVEIDREKTAYFQHINHERSVAERNMYNLLMQAPVGIAIYRGETFIIELANQRILELWDKNEDEVLNKPFFDVQPHFKDQGFNEMMLTVMREGEGVTIQEVAVTLVRKDHTRDIYIKLICEPLRNDDNNVTGVMILAHDITAQVLARKQIEASELRFRSMVEQSPVPIAILRGDQFIMEVTNNAYLRLIDRTLEQVADKPLLVAMPELKTQGILDILRNVYETGKEFTADDYGVVINIEGHLELRYFSFIYKLLKSLNDEPDSVMAVVWDVTNMVTSKFALEQSQKEFETTFMESPMGMAVLRGPDLVVENANTAMLTKFWLRTEEEVKGKSVTQIFPELNGHRYTDLLRKVMSTGMHYREYESESVIRMETGPRTFYFDFQYGPLRDSEGNVSGIMLTVYDVTERVLDRKKIQEAEERSRLAIEATGLGTFDWNLSANEFVFSDRLAQIFGHSDRRHFQHQDLVNLIHPDDLHIRNEAVKASLLSGSLNYQVRLVWPNKTIHWISVYGKVAYDQNKEPVRLYGTVLDISRERTYQHELEQSEEKFRSLANFLPQFIWTSDVDGTLTYYNQAIHKFSGLTKSEIQTGGWLQLVHPDDRAAIQRKLEKSYQNGNELNAEARFRHKDGSYRWQLGRTVALKDDSENIRMWIGTSIDIHDRKMMAEELEKRVEARTAELKLANEELLRTNQELEQFAYVSSHDLQEPLRKIQTFSELVSNRIGNTHPDVKLYLEKIHSSAKRMSVLIHDLLNYSRVSKSDEQFVSVDLNRVLINILNDFEVLLKQKNGEILVENLPVISGIPIQINQLFYNLISNSLKFSLADPVIKITAEDVEGVNLPADIALPHDRSYVVLRFTDNGIGFEQMYASQIFTIFQRLNNRAKYGGTGIGLAICKKIAENHGGMIVAESEVNKGATFTVYIAR